MTEQIWMIHLIQQMGFLCAIVNATPTDSTESFQEDHGMISYTQSICTLFNTESLGTMCMSR